MSTYIAQHETIRPPPWSPAHPRLVALLSELAGGEGYSPSRLPEVKFLRLSQNSPRVPCAYEPGLVILAQGRRTGYFAEKTFVYDASHYLVLSAPLPFECETEVSPEGPFLALCVGVTPALVAELVVQMRPPAPADEEPAQAIEATPLDHIMNGAAVRLLEALRSDDDARILGPQIVRELTYRALAGERGQCLRALAAPRSHFARINRIIHRLHADFARDHDVASLAREAGMSVSRFHAHFKAVALSSPLQYLKNVRLHKAMMLMVHEGATASAAAMRVGYESASQFSREFKRLYGDGPSAVAERMRHSLIRLA